MCQYNCVFCDDDSKLDCYDCIYCRYFIEYLDIFYHICLTETDPKNIHDKIIKKIPKNIVNAYNIYNNRELPITEEKKLISLKTKQTLIWMRITKPDNIDIHKWLKEILILKNKPQFENVFYTIEASKYENNEFRNIHSHILCHKKIGWNEKKIKDWILKYISVFNNYIDYKTYPLSFWNDKLDYIKGIKFDEEKETSLNITKEFRKTYNIENFY